MPKTKQKNSSKKITDMILWIIGIIIIILLLLRAFRII
jgi:uncharacterized phage infection (PIP) family protein YhgE